MRTQTDGEIKDAVEDELEWRPEIEPANIGVSVSGGVVMLSGEVGSYTEKVAANEAAARVTGVVAVVDDIVTKASQAYAHGDVDIARHVRERLSELPKVAPSSIQISVHDGIVELHGEVEWNYQREAAHHAIERVAGVRGVLNELRLTKRASATDAKERIQNALLRDAAIDAGAITVRVDHNDVTLTGIVRSAYEKKRAADAAWASPHVAAVHNHLTVEPGR